MPDSLPISKDKPLRDQVRETREAYFDVSAELDDLNLEIRTKTHGMVAPDGTHAIENLSNRKRFAFEQYQKALGDLTVEMRGSRAADVSSPGTKAVRIKPGQASNGRPQLTAREVQVLDRIALGLTSKEIARELNISFKTAVTHRTHLMSKFDATNVALLIRRAIACGHVKP
jgi:DNA-binding CsgD family transcriptional regulator